MLNWSPTGTVATFATCIVAIGASAYLLACPFCSAINLTFAEQIKTNDIVVIAELLEIPEPVADPDLELPKSRFRVTDVIKGHSIVPNGAEFRSLLVGQHPIGDKFLVMGVDPPNVAWSTPMKASDRVVGYLRKIQELPKSGAKRLAFFQKYFEDEESVLAFDAYDEFAAAPYEDVRALKDDMNREQLVKWIQGSDTLTNRRRLYFTMLGVCGEDSDIAMLEEFIRSGDRKKQAGLDALIACYLTLKGRAGLDLVTDTFLKDKEVEYVDTLAAVSALRFHGTEIDIVPKKAIVKSIRTLLDRPKIADMIIPDLARWEDWSVMERLVQMFKDADEETSWLRVPIASYLRACPHPEAKNHIADLQKIDPDAIKRADFFLDFDNDSADEEEAVSEESEEKPAKPTAEPADTDQTTNDDSETDLLSGETYVAHRVTIPDAPEVSLNIDTGVSLNPNPASDIAVSKNTSTDSTNGKILEVAQSKPELTPVASANLLTAPLWQIILIPFLCSIFIFALLWSVISGWFDQLIF